MKKNLFILLAILLIVNNSAFAGGSTEKTDGAADKYKMKIGHIRPVGTSIDKDLTEFTNSVTKKTEGRIEFTMYPASQLGDYTIVQERVSIGDVEMHIGPIATAVDKRVNIYSMPYLVSNWDEAKIAYGPEGKLAKYMSDLLDKQNLKLIAGYPVYFGGIMTVKEVPNYTDIEAPKNIKIRVPPIKSFELTGEALGFLATPIPWADTFTSLQTGVVNGAIGAGAEGYHSNFKDLAKYYLPINDHLEFWYLYMNKDLWNKLSKADQKIILDSALEFQAKRWEKAPGEEKSYEDKLAAIGVKVYSYSKQELRRAAEVSRKIVWPAMGKDIDLNMLEAVAKEAEGK